MPRRLGEGRTQRPIRLSQDYGAPELGAQGLSKRSSLLSPAWWRGPSGSKRYVASNCFPPCSVSGKECSRASHSETTGSWSNTPAVSSATANPPIRPQSSDDPPPITRHSPPPTQSPPSYPESSDDSVRPPKAMATPVLVPAFRLPAPSIHKPIPTAPASVSRQWDGADAKQEQAGWFRDSRTELQIPAKKTGFTGGCESFRRKWCD
jgi:hypothetical protein